MDIEESRKGAVVVEAPGGGFGGGEKTWFSGSISWSRIPWREFMRSQGGGAMLARRCFLRRRASQRGMFVLCGGVRVGVLPWELLVLEFRYDWREGAMSSQLKV